MSQQYPQRLDALVHRYPALGYPLYRRYWLASFASVGATQLINIGQGWLIFELTGSALQLGLLGAAAALPNILVTLFGGVIADRFDKRQILRATSGTIAILLTLLAWLDYSGQVAVWQVLTIAALFSLITGLDWPARVAIFPHFVERPAFMSAVALNSFIWQVTRMAIPAVGGLLIYWVDTWLVFALSASGFFIMYGVMTSIRIRLPAHEQASPIKALLEGIDYIIKNDVFKWLIGITFIGMFFSQSFVQIMPIFTDALGASKRGYGMLLSAGGLGAIVGTLAIGRLTEGKTYIGHFMFAGAGLSVLALAVFVWAVRLGWYVPALTMVFAAAACSSAFLITSMTTLQLRVPDPLRGRVMGIHTIGYSLVPLGGVWLGWLAERLDAGSAVLYGGGVYLLVLTIAWLRKTNLRQLSASA